ncbi:MAG TPA: NUDIX domain-containing protein [Anaerolineales bacterium]
MCRVFGEKIAGQTYVERPGAYAVIQNARRRIATLRVGTAYFLPGGGTATDETLQLALEREIMEECGRPIKIGRELGKATEYMYVGDEEVYYLIRSTFFEARFLGWRVQRPEDNHVLVWLSAAEAIQRLRRRSQAWAVQQLVSSMPGFPLV